MIPASGEFTYATEGVRKGGGGAQVAENLNALPDATDMVVALDLLQASAPHVESVSLVVAWFGDDLRTGSCKVRPGVEVSAKSTTPASWSVNGVSRASAFLVSRDDQDRPVYGGTPSDFAVVQAIQEMKARGRRVTFYPFILMDVPPGNSLPNPYSDDAAETGQPAFPWRGRIGAPDAVLMDLPQLTEVQPAHRPLAAAHAIPWPGDIAVFRSRSTDGFELLTSFGMRARIGTLVSDFFAGPTSRFDLGNALVVDLLTGTLESVTDLTLFRGANALAIESAPGVWEIVQAGAADLLAPGRYRLTQLRRGQRGTGGRRSAIRLRHRR